jgi:hypothetical protein
VKDGPVGRYPDSRIIAGVRVFPRVDRFARAVTAGAMRAPAMDADSSLTVAAPCGIRTHFPCRRAQSVVWPEYSMAKLTSGVVRGRSARENDTRGLSTSMSRRSSVTLREQPVADATSVTGAFRVHTETLTIQTNERLQLIDLTEQVMSTVRGLHVKEGVVNLFSMHTTCTV